MDTCEMTYHNSFYLWATSMRTMRNVPPAANTQNADPGPYRIIENKKYNIASFLSIFTFKFYLL